jgi:DUF1365 family protein
MPLSSCLYECEVMHQRLSPRRYALQHALFMLYLDLDDIDRQARRLRLFSRNRWNLYSFRDDDHMPGCGGTAPALRARLEQYLASEGIALPAEARIGLLTLPRRCFGSGSPSTTTSRRSRA